MSSRGSVRLRSIAYFVLCAATVFGVSAIVTLFNKGHLSVNTTQNVPWGLWVPIYVFLLGLSAGSFMLSTLIYVFGVKRLESAGPLALSLALGCLLLGGFLIVIDLGHPLLIYKILSSMNPSSVMAWMGIFYSVYAVVVLAELYFALRFRLVRYLKEGRRPAWLYSMLSLGNRDMSAEGREKDKKLLKIIGIVGIPAAIAGNGGLGTVFAVVKASPNWFGGLFPIIFLISALVSGGALLTFVTAFASKQPQEKKLALTKQLAHLTIGILCFDVLLLVSEVLVTFYGNIPREASGWRTILLGHYWWVFWIVQVGMGIILPVFIVASSRLNRSVKWLGAAGFLMILGILALRINIIIPPQLEPAFPTLPEAYHHFRFAYGYVPSVNEWFVGLGIFAVGIWGCLIANRLLPLEEEQLPRTL